MKIMVTGGAGFIGANLVRFLNSHYPDVEVLVYDDLSTGKKENLHNTQCNLIIGTILDFTKLVEVFADVDAVVHLAAIPSVPRSILDPFPTHQANTTGTLNVLQAAREAGVGHVSVASSSSVYGSNPSLPKSEDTWTRPLSPYGVSKLATEGYALAFRTSYGLNTIAFRFFNVFGPLQSANQAYAAVIPKFLEATKQNRPVYIEGTGNQSRDFTYVDTVCDVLSRAAVNKIGHDAPVNLAFGTNTSIIELTEKIGNVLSIKIPLDFVEPRKSDVFASQADGISIRKLFPEVVPIDIDSAIRTTIDWFMNSNQE